MENFTIKQVKPKVAVLSLSGGMDSTCLLIHLLANGYEVHCISFNYGQKHSIELERARQNINYLKSLGYSIPHTIVDLSSAMSHFESALISDSISVPEGHYEESNMKATVVPNRNAIFSSIIYGHALSLSTQLDCSVAISLGIHSGDHAIYPDCRQEFRDALEHAFKIGNWGGERVSYYTPYLHGNKTSILEDCLLNCQDLELDFDTILANTNTSYNPDMFGRSSGKSGADIERIEAFINIGRKDPVTYQQPWEVVRDHAISVLSKSKSNENSSN